MSNSKPVTAAADISVCICTYDRDHVAETIRSVLEQVDVSGRLLEIVVADDDPHRSAEGIVTSTARDAPVPVRYVHSGARNIAAARNACLDAAQGAWIAFIDDDEIADARWLASLCEIQAQWCADVVKGCVRGVYPDETPAWVLSADPYTRDYGAEGAEPATMASGNVLFRRSLADSIRFNPAYGRSGGEDSDFFRRIRASGAKIVSGRRAIVNEIIPPSRVTSRCLKSRHRRFGQTDGRKIRNGEGNYSLARAVAIAARALTIFWVHPLLRAAGSRAAFQFFSGFWYGIGLIEGLLGRTTEEVT